MLLHENLDLPFFETVHFHVLSPKPKIQLKNSQPIKKKKKA